MSGAKGGQSNLERMSLRMVEHYSTAQRLGYASLDEDLKLVEIAPHLAAMLALPESPQPGQLASEAIDLLLGTDEALREVLTGKRDFFAFERIRLPGSAQPDRYLDLRVLPMRPGDPAQGLLLLVEDSSRSGTLEQNLTQQRNELALLRDQLAQRAALLEARNQALDAFGHAVAHDLRNPLASILATTDLIEMLVAADPQKALPHVGQLRLSAMRMEDIISSLLMLATLRQDELRVEPIPAGVIAEDVALHLAVRLREARVDLQIEQPLPTVMAQKTLLMGVFTNLIDNAIKYIGSKNTAPKIQVRGKAEGAMARFEIEDNGLGISEEAQGRLFQMFQRAHVTEAQGFGVGLAVVSQVVRRLGGEVGVSSKVRQGSTFWFTLPLAPQNRETMQGEA